jgi:hypothetical protein
MLIHSLKTYLVIFFIGYAAFAYSQTPPATANEGHGSEEVGIIDAIGNAIFAESGSLKSKIMLWGGSHKHLFGYRDIRYKKGDEDSSQNDYLTTNAQYGGLEMYVAGFGEINKSMKDTRFGFNTVFYKHGSFAEKNLYAVPLHGIPEEIVPPDTEISRKGKWWGIIGAFVGNDGKWIGIDLGITLRFTIINEDSRYKLDPNSNPSNPTYVKTDGRGLLFDDSYVVPNLFLRMGMERLPHFTFSIFRDNFDPAYGSIMSKVIFPVGQYFKIAVGGYLWQTQSGFIEPALCLFGFELSLRGGVIINYPEDELERVGIKESIFWSATLSYKW